MGGIIIIERLALSLTNQMVQERLINNEQKDDYVYAMVTSLEKVISIGTILIISIFARKIFHHFFSLFVFMN